MIDGNLYEPGSVFQSAPPPSENALAAAARYGVSTMSVGLGGSLARQRLLDAHELPRVAGEGVVAGTALTVWNPQGSTRMTGPAIKMSRPGDVIVISADRETVQWGDVAASLAKARQVAGVVIDGAVRDVDRMREVGLSTWARRIYAGQGFSKEAGLINVPVTIGSTVIRPGDIVIADGDGIFSIPPSLLSEAVRRAETKDHEDSLCLEAAAEGGVADVMAAWMEGRVSTETSTVSGEPPLLPELHHLDFTYDDVAQGDHL